MSSSSLTPYSTIPFNGYYATWDYPEESCMYKGSISLIPSKPLTPLSPLEGKMRKFAVNLENGHRVLPTLVQLSDFRASVTLFHKYNIRKLANKYLYKMDTMTQVVKLAERIERMEKKEQKKMAAMAADSSSDVFSSGNISATQSSAVLPSSSGSSPTDSSSPSSTSSDSSTNIFLSGSIDVSSTLDRLLAFVNNN